mgnify:CR=1 FL=1
MIAAYVYIRSEPLLWTVGFYDPNGVWNAESDHRTSEVAAARVRHLNGGDDERLKRAVVLLRFAVRYLEHDEVMAINFVFSSATMAKRIRTFLEQEKTQ